MKILGCGALVLFGLLVAACGSKAVDVQSDLGEPLTPANGTAYGPTLSADGARLDFVLLHADSKTQDALLELDLKTRATRQLYDAASHPTLGIQLPRTGSDSSVFFLEIPDPPPPAPLMLPLIRVSADGSDVRTLGKCTTDDFAEFAVSPDAKNVACTDQHYNVQLIDIATGTATLLNDHGNAIVFSPDGKELLVGEGAGLGPNIGGLTAKLVRVSTSDPQATPIPAHFSGQELLAVRWHQGGLVALTRTSGAVQLEDLSAGTSRSLWQEPQGASMAYEWADTDHVFQFAAGKCTQYDGEFSCKRARFDFALRTLSTGEQRHLAQGEASGGGRAFLLPNGHQFVWLVDNRIYLHEM